MITLSILSLRVIHTLTRPLVYIHNRWIVPSHKIVIRNSEFGIGRYHDSDSRMLYALFQLVVDYVEIECAALNSRFETPVQKWRRRLTYIPVLTWFIPYPRNVRRGLHYLRWSIKLKDEQGGLEQSQFASDIFKLYTFWIHTRPRRSNPWDTYISERETRDWKAPLTDYDRSLMQEADRIERLQDDEDTQMLNLIVNIRNRMWT